uniref:Uncharacterized protein n=1 Tax=Anguilla anguilla TaxID=7936 RepID=A0A0E9WHQ3_ANGAN
MDVRLVLESCSVCGFSWLTSNQQPVKGSKKQGVRTR